MDDNSQRDTDESSRKMASSLEGKGKQSMHDLCGPVACGGQRIHGDCSKSLHESALHITGPECCSS